MGTYTYKGADVEEAVKPFVPEYVQLAKTYSKNTRKATITAKCLSEVAAATIGGVTAKMKTIAGYHNFSASFTKVKSGTEFELVLYDTNGVASEPYYITVK